MFFVVIGYDGPYGQEGRRLYREEHLRRLEDLCRKGKLILAGPFSDKSGSLIVVEAESREEVEAFMEKDPYVVHGVFTRYEIRPFVKVFPQD